MCVALHQQASNHILNHTYSAWVDDEDVVVDVDDGGGVVDAAGWVFPSPCCPEVCCCWEVLFACKT